MSDPFSGITGALIMKFGIYKIIGGVSAIFGAAIMVLFRPHETKISLFLHCLVALGTSLLWGGTAVNILTPHLDFLKTATQFEIYQFIGSVHGLIGATSWSAWSAARVFLSRGEADPVQLAKDVKNIL